MRGGRRGGRGGGKRARADDEPAEEPRQQANEAATNGAAPPASHAASLECHYQVRKAIHSVIMDPAFQETSAAHGNVVLATEHLLEPLCAACDAVGLEEPFEAPVSRESLLQQVQRCVAEVCSVSDVVDTFASLFAAKAVAFIPKRRSASCPTLRSEQRPRGGRGGRGGQSRSEDDAVPSSSEGVLGMPPPLEEPVVCSAPSSFEGLLPPPQHANAFTAAPLLAPPHYGYAVSVPFAAFPQPPQLASPLTTRCVTLDHVPAHFTSGEAMRPQLSNICGRMRNVFFFNTHHIPGSNRVVVSLNSVEAATELVVRMNYMSQVDGSPVLARGATAEEEEALFAPLRAQLQDQEAATQAKLAEYERCEPTALRSQWHRAREEIMTCDQQLAALSDQCTPFEKLTLLKTKLRVSEQQKDAAERLAALGAPLEGPEDAYSSSSASVGSGATLLYISGLPSPMPDNKFLLFFEPFKHHASLVHVWRDAASPSRLCCALQSAGQVFAVLRVLDANKFTFCGAEFGKNRPPAVS